MLIRTTLDETGRFRVRRLPLAEAAQAGRATLERKDQIHKAVGEPGRPLVDPHIAALEASVPVLERVVVGRTDEAPAPGEASELVLSLLRDPGELTSVGLFNHLVDHYVNVVEAGLESAKAGPRALESVKSAGILYDRLFGRGKGFLSYGSLRQWHHVHVAFNLMSAEDLDLARTAGVADRIGWVQALNEHFATLLRVDIHNIDALLEGNPELADDPGADALGDALDATLEALMGLTVCANGLWPDPTRGALRLVLCGHYLDALQLQIARRSKQIRAGLQDKP